MAVKPGPPITFTDLRGEFGGGPANSLGDYVRGGAFVPNGPSQNASIPTAPPISLGNFYGALKGWALTAGKAAGADVFGYQRGQYGVLSPDTVNGANIDTLATAVNLVITLQGSRAQNFFAQLEAFNTDGTALFSVQTATADNYFDSGATTSWTWNAISPFVNGSQYTLVFT